MGCKHSKPKGDCVPPQSGGTAPVPKKPEPAEVFVRSFLGDAERFFSNLSEPQPLRVIQGTVFLNSVAEVLRLTFRMKMIPTNDLLRAVFGTSMPLLQESLAAVEDHCADDGYTRLLNGWETQNPEHKRKVSGKAMQAILRSTEIHVQNLQEGDFGDLLQHFTTVSMSNEEVNDLFTIYSTDGFTIQPAEFLSFLREAQGQENATDRAAAEKIRSRFGGTVTKYNFNSYLGGLITNSALDPQRASNVWQDMTQPLPHYIISTTHVESEAELVKAMRESVRALVVTCTKKDDGEIYSGSCRLSLILDTVKQSGFKDSGYPIVMCFNPSHTMDIALQEEVAALVKAKLGPMLARGIMFEGAMINDPNFSPAALQRKVLLMGNQAPLKPFVGFHVADMNRDGLGVRVTDVQGSTPASKAGIAKDDWLTHINGAQIHNKKHLREQLALFHLGDEFTMKKENLDEVRVVVGGAVSCGDNLAAHSLSDLIFLKFVQAGEPPRDHYFPWESSAATGNDLSNSPNKRDLCDHFLYVSQPPREADNTDAYAGEATTRGAQFVDAGGRVETHTWARGLFTDNAHCGYLLKTSIGSAEGSAEVTLKIVSTPLKMRGARTLQIAARMHGSGRIEQVDDMTFVFMECQESSVAIVELYYELNDVKCSFTASFPPTLLRNGYRVLPVIETSEELAPTPVTHGVFCKITTERDNIGTLLTSRTE